MREEHVLWMLVFAAGTVTGLFYFGGLWATVRLLPAARRPTLLLLTSFAVRTTLAAAILCLAAGRHWERLALALAGFVLARAILTGTLGRKRRGPAALPKGTEPRGN